MNTIKDIANAVGVSPTTVTNVIRGRSGRVSPQTQARIHQAIADMQYVPNLSARSLVSRSSHIVGVVSHTAPAKIPFLQDPFYGALLSGIEQTLRASGYFMMVREIEAVSELSSLMANWNIDGLILTGMYPAHFRPTVSMHSIPILMSEGTLSDPNALHVVVADEQGGYLATRHLLQCGHRDILLVSPPLHAEGVVRDRFRGYARALQEWGLSVRPHMTVAQEIDMEKSRELGLTLSHRRDFTAIFATADVLAWGLMAGLAEGGRTVPQDVSIVGFDDLQFARMMSPPLTTISQAVIERGRVSAQMLIAAMENPKTASRDITLPVTLVERGSVRTI